jgi:hypothetical protein
MKFVNFIIYLEYNESRGILFMQKYEECGWEPPYPV